MAFKSLGQIKHGPLWMVVSLTGAGIGIWLANLLVPSVIPSASVGGLFTWEMVGVSLTIALVVGFSQSLALLRFLQAVPAAGVNHARAAALLWAPLTAVGLFTIFFPVWCIEGDALLVVPVLGLTAPGILILAALQSVAIHWWVPWYQWLWRTAAGLCLGVSVGIIFADFTSVFASFSTSMGLSLWAAVVALSVAGMQYAPIENLRQITSGRIFL